MRKEAAKLVEMFQLMLVVCALFGMDHSMGMFLVRIVSIHLILMFSLQERPHPHTRMCHVWRWIKHVFLYCWNIKQQINWHLLAIQKVNKICSWFECMRTRMTSFSCIKPWKWIQSINSAVLFSYCLCPQGLALIIINLHCKCIF